MGGLDVVSRLARTGWHVTRMLPGGALAERELFKLETAVIAGLHRKPAPEPVTLVLTSGTAGLRSGMAELLNRSVNIDAAGAASHLYATILSQLLPDEARIVAALADGKPRPAVDIVLRGPLGGGRGTVLRNASTIGRSAGVSAPEYVPMYVTRLSTMGLVDVGEEDSELAEQYDILMTDQRVRQAEQRGHRVKIVRHTVLLSELGHRFWQAADPTTVP